MNIIIDEEEKTLVLRHADNREEKMDLYSPKAFEIISKQWLKVGWDQKYVYTFSWLGRPIIQLPEDMIRIQEVIFKVQPDVIIETGVAHGGSLVYNASLCKVIEKGRVIGIDIEIRPNNRKAIDEHPLKPMITLVEGSSTDQKVVKKVNDLIKPRETVLVILDSNHSKRHVLEELKCYSPLVSVGSYVVATDGIMKEVWDVPRGEVEWEMDNPMEAARDFITDNNSFVLEAPQWPFNESPLKKAVTHWPCAYLRRMK